VNTTPHRVCSKAGVFPPLFSVIPFFSFSLSLSFCAGKFPLVNVDPAIKRFRFSGPAQGGQTPAPAFSFLLVVFGWTFFLNWVPCCLSAAILRFFAKQFCVTSLFCGFAARSFQIIAAFCRCQPPPFSPLVPPTLSFFLRSLIAPPFFFILPVLGWDIRRLIAAPPFAPVRGRTLDGVAYSELRLFDSLLPRIPPLLVLLMNRLPPPPTSEAAGEAPLPGDDNLVLSFSGFAFRNPLA